MTRRSGLSVRLSRAPYRPPWARHDENWKAPEVVQWVEPEWFTEAMYAHPYFKWVPRHELEYFAKRGRLPSAKTCARLAAEAEASVQQTVQNSAESATLAAS